jgi:capsular polysaccharide biosynthesis protein
MLRRLKGAVLIGLAASARRDARSALLFARVLALSPDRRYRRPSRLPLEWLDECPPTTTMRPATDGCAYGPNIRGRQVVAPVVLPAVARHEFRDVRVSAASSSVLLSDRLIVERVPGVDAARCDCASGHLLAHGERVAIVASRPEERLDVGVFLAGNGSSNYYHWLLELLPKLEFVEDVDWPLLVSADAHGATFRDALSRIAGERPIVFLDNERTYRVSRLLYVTSPILCPFNLRRGEAFRPEDFLLHPASIRFLRGRLSSPRSAGAGPASRRIFMARRPGRRDYNQDEIFAILSEHGFEKVHMEDLSLSEQIETVASAEMIAGPTGAAWTNLLFARRGTRCLCWMAEELRGFAGYSNLAHAVGADLRYVTYRAGAQDTHALYALDYRVDPTEIEREVRRLSE